MHKTLSLGCLILFSLLVPRPVAAQKLEATIVYQNGEVEAVLLNNRAFHKLNRLETADPKRVIPFGEVSRVEVGGATYEPRRVLLHNIFQVIFPNEAPSPPVDTVLLLQRIRGGTLSLFYHLDRSEGEHWFVEKDSRIQELMQVKMKSGMKEGTKDRYKGVLNLFASDCPDIKKSYIERLQLKQEDFVKFVDRYNLSCGSGEYVAHKEKARLEAGALAGSQQQSYTFEGEPFYGLEKVENNTPYIGLYLRYPLNLGLERLAFVASPRLSLSSLALDLDYEGYGSSIWDTIIYRGSFRAQFLDVPLSLRLTLPFDNSRMKPFVQGGANFRGRLRLQENEGRYIRRRRPYYEWDHESVTVHDLPKLSVYYDFRFGFTYQRFEAGVNYSFGTGGITGWNTEKTSILGIDLRCALLR